MIIAATGHRPEKLGGYTADVRARLLQVAKEYLAFQPFVSEVVSGMALGWDQAVAHAAFDLGIPYVAAVPFSRQPRPWSPEAQAYYRKLLDRSVRVHVVCDVYHPQAFQERNEWMVDYSHRIMALFDGQKGGGTYNCIRYASELNRPIDNLWKEFKC